MASILKFEAGLRSGPDGRSAKIPQRPRREAVLAPQSVPRDDAEKEQADPLTPELKEFIEKVIAPCLVRRYLRKLGSEKPVAESNQSAPSFSSMGHTERQANQ